MLSKKLLSGAALTALSLSMGGLANAQETAAGIRGVVTDAEGSVVSDADVIITHEPSGTVRTQRTNEAGAFFASGLRIGGPYTVVVEAPGFEGSEYADLFLDPGEIEPLRAQLQGANEEIVVLGVRNRLSLNEGAGSSYDADDVANQPSFNRDLVSTLLRDPLASSPTGAQGTLQVAGLNPRLNGLVIDGVRVQDDFRLGASTYPTTRSPVSLDTVEAVSLAASDYSVTASGFQGGAINVVTRSGTNDFHGSLYYYGTNDGLIGDRVDGRVFNPGTFEETEQGFTLGGPIIRDKLFFFVGYEEFESARPATFTSADAQDQITDTAIFEELSNIIDTSLGYADSGGRPDTVNNASTTNRLLAKIDWNITDDHRATFSYSTVEETGIAVDNLSLLSAWYSTPTNLETWSAQVFSDWTPNLSTTFRVANKVYDRGQICNAGDGVGEIQVRFNAADAVGTALEGMLTGASDRTFLAGCDRFRHGNTFADERTQVFGSANYVMGEHLLTFGADWETYELDNLFISDSLGTWIFDGSSAAGTNGLQNLIDGEVDRIVYRNVPSNDASSAAAQWGYDKLALFLGDRWQIADNFEVTAGLRYETYIQDDQPPARADFLAAYGRSNQDNLDGRDILMPRVGFRWEPADRTLITGGFGLFAGGDPHVWISNAFSPQIFETAITNSPNADPTTIPQVLIDNIAAANPNTPTFIDVIDPNFEIPSQWKFSLRLEQEFDLNFGGLNLGENYIFTAQYLHSDTRYGYRWRNLAVLDLPATQPPGVAPDGRPIYANLQTLGINNAIELTNSEGGAGDTFAFSLSKDYENGLDFYISYAHSEVEGVTPGTSSRGVSNYSSIIDFDRNNPYVGRSEFEQEERIAINFGYERAFFGDLMSRVDLFGTFASGEPYSFTFDTSGTNPLFGRPGNNENPFDNDLLYVPEVVAGVFSDPRVVFAPGFDQAAFLAYIDSRGLPTGEIVSRHSNSSAWDSRWDLRFQQDLPFASLGQERLRNNRLQFVFDIENVLNLLNDHWGTDRDGAGFDVAQVVGADLVSAANPNGPALTGDAPRTVCIEQDDCVYRYNTFTSRPTSFNDDAGSVYRIRFGVRYEF